MIYIFPKINNTITNIENSNTVTLGKCFKFDFLTGQHIILDGKFVECDFKENINSFIQVVLRTKKDIFKVYTVDEEEDFGLSIYSHIGNKILHKGYILSETKREITEQLLNHPFIKEVDNFNFDFKDITLTITFDCYLQNNEILNIREDLQVEF
ncbi:MAG: DUF2634 domain-containing protein [Thomasclavelia ramosa]